MPLDAWVASSFMRVSMLLNWSMAPSARLIMATPSFALRFAWVREAICWSMLCAMLRPAASSCAPLMRLPEDRRSIAVSIWARESVRCRWAVIEAMFVLITIAILVLLKV